MASYIKASLERSYAESFLLELERNENQYFLFVGKGTTWENGENAPSSYTDTVRSEYQVMNDAVGYKKLNPDNILFALPKIPWIGGTVYDQYDDGVELFSESDPKVFYVVTDENHVYKCLFNGGGVPSTQKPSLVITSPFFTSDGYQWKYLATVRESDLPYELSDYLPIDFSVSSTDTETQNQFNVQATAVNGSITRIDTQNAAGASVGLYPYTVFRDQYENMGQYVLRVQSVTPTADPTVKRVRVIDDPRGSLPLLLKQEAQSNYLGQILRIEKNPQFPQEVNNYGVIVGFQIPTTNSSREIVFDVKNDAIDFSVTVEAGQDGQPSAEILPYVKVVGDGNGAYAFPVMRGTLIQPGVVSSGVNSTIESVDVIDGGRDYSVAKTYVVGSLQNGTVHPTLRPVMSPKGGHGSNILKELNIQEIIVVVSLTDEDSQKIVSGGTYRQFGIVKNPLLRDGTVAGTDGKSLRNITLVTPQSQNAVAEDFDLGETCAVIGKESFASARVVAVNSIEGDKISLKTLNSFGRFVSRQDRIRDYVLSLDRENGNLFAIGETVVQTIPAGTTIGEVSYGFQVEIRGIVLQKTLDTLTVRVTSAGNFIGNYEIGSLTSGQTADVDRVVPRFGESVWVTESVPPAFLPVQYKIYEVGTPYFERELTPSYSGLHALELTTSVSGTTGAIDTTSVPLALTSFVEGEGVEQGVLMSSLSNYARGTVYKWEYINPSRGILYLTGVLGRFRAVDTDGIDGSRIGQYTLSSVRLPEIDPTSGEVVYIDNVRAVRRVAGQEEEFRIRLGF